MFRRRRHPKKNPRAPIAIAPAAIPTPIPAFALVERLDEPVGVDVAAVEVELLVVDAVLDDGVAEVVIVEEVELVVLELELELELELSAIVAITF